jgi:Na+-transporting NADH:ubiquinone oxidoreductase subunit NqrB
MWAMAQSSISLFLRGRLFAEPSKAYRQIVIGVLVTALLLVAIVVAGAPVWVASIVASAIGGALQPDLFRNLRYR